MKAHWRTTALPLVSAALLLASCVFLPRKTTEYDVACGGETHHMVLEQHQVAVLGNCVGDACAGLLVVYGAVTAGSLVVSGSITVVGNVVYWVQRQVQCPAPAPPERPT